MSCYNLKKRTLILFGFLSLFSIVGSIAVATAQDTVHPLLTLSSNKITFYAKENGDSQSVDLTLVGLTAGDGVNVKIVAVKLYDNSSGQDISISITPIDADDFDLTQYEDKTVTVNLDPSGEKAGTYEGVLIITATNNTAPTEILTTNIKVTAIIEGAAPWYKSVIVQIIFVVCAVVPMIIGLGIPDKEIPKYKYSKKPWLVFLGAISVFFWLASIVSFSFNEPGTIINTVVVTPFLTYVISFVKDKRTERLELEKASREIRAKGIENDINLIRAIMGEIATHCASFKPHLYKPIAKSTQKSKNPRPKQTTEFDEFRKILFIKSGKVTRKVWDESCKQGQVADLPLLELEKYYDFLDTYNRYYSRAIKLTKNNKPSQVELKDFDFEVFGEFREAYAELETVVFIYLSYLLGTLSKTCLSPLKATYRLIARTLLLRLLEYGILEPEKYNKQIEVFLKYHHEDAYYLSYLEARKKELRKQNFTGAEKETETLRFIIKKWHFDAEDMEEIHEDIYDRDIIPRFYERITDDFRKKFVILKNIIAKLPPIKDESEEPEKKRIEMSGQLAVLKGKEVSDAQAAAKIAKDAAEEAERSAIKAQNAASRRTKRKNEPAARP